LQTSCQNRIAIVAALAGPQRNGVCFSDIGVAAQKNWVGDAAGHTGSGNYLIYGMASQAIFCTDSGSSRGLDATVGFD